MAGVTKQALRVYIALSNLGERDGDIVGVLSAYALWAAYMNIPIVFLAGALNRFGKYLLETRGEKRVSSGCLTEQLPLISFDDGLGKRPDS
jgi:hypothetical protein